MITDTYSHMFGEAVLDSLHSSLKKEVEDIVTSTPIPQASKQSKEKTKAGRTVWSGKDFNRPLEASFRGQGWERRKIYFPEQTRYYIDVDFAKDGVAVEIQFGKYAFVQHDFSKFRYLFEEGDEKRRINVGIEVVPSAALQKRMYTGPANFDSVVASLLAHARNDPAVPVWLLAIDVK
ncbi:MAG: BglII/BstYI family type II restriction endonuclease [Dehalococcoidia bacterium]